jgi:uncharacterized membrane protein
VILCVYERVSARRERKKMSLDLGVLFGLVAATVGTVVVWYYGWYDRNENKTFRYMLNLLASMVVFLWVGFGLLFYGN